MKYRGGGCDRCGGLVVPTRDSGHTSGLDFTEGDRRASTSHASHARRVNYIPRQEPGQAGALEEVDRMRCVNCGWRCEPGHDADDLIRVARTISARDAVQS